MNVLHVVALGPSSELGLPGPCNVALEECKALLSSGHSASIFTTHSGGPSRKITLVEGVSITSYRRVQLLQRSLAAIWSIGLVSSVAKARNRFDVMHLHVSRDLTLMAIMLFCSKRIRWVAQTHGQIQARTPVHYWFDRLCTSRLLNRARTVFALQGVERSFLLRAGVEDDRIRILGNRTSVSARDANRFRLFPNDRLELAFVAHLRPAKMVQRVIDLSYALESLGVRHRLRIAGADGGDLQAVRAAAESVSSIQYIGAISHDEVVRLLAECQFLVFAPDDEPFGMSVIESLVLGTPVVCGSGVHVLSDSGLESGVIRSDSAEIAQLAAAVALHGSASHWVSLSDRARSAGAVRFGASSYGRELVEFYNGG